MKGWPEEMSEPRADQMAVGKFETEDGCRCLVGWAMHDFGITPGSVRPPAYLHFIRVLQQTIEEHVGHGYTYVAYANDYVLKTNRERAMIYRRAVVRCGYTEVVQ